jgi:hypothetical protein
LATVAAASNQKNQALPGTSVANTAAATTAPTAHTVAHGQRGANPASLRTARANAAIATRNPGASNQNKAFSRTADSNAPPVTACIDFRMFFDSPPPAMRAVATHPRSPAPRSESPESRESTTNPTADNNTGTTSQRASATRGQSGFRVLLRIQ